MKKIPFDLSLWLKDKSQKVVTRDGKSVKILCTDCRADQPIVALVTFTYEGGGTYESVETYNENGHYWSVGNKDAELDLFLVTEDEPELTEFEKTVSDLCWRVGMGEAVKDASQIKREADKLLTIARKQLKAEGWEYTDPLLKEIEAEKLNDAKLETEMSCFPKIRKQSPALTKIVENLTPEKLEKTKKEIEHDIWVEAYCEGEKHGMEVGRKQVLQGLPKWKKAPRCHSPLAELLGDQLHYNGYYIKLSGLEKLPKE